jgi:hypothetical protein
MITACMLPPKGESPGHSADCADGRGLTALAYLRTTGSKPTSATVVASAISAERHLPIWGGASDRPS